MIEFNYIVVMKTKNNKKSDFTQDVLASDDFSWPDVAVEAIELAMGSCGSEFEVVCGFQKDSVTGAWTEIGYELSETDPASDLKTIIATPAVGDPITFRVVSACEWDIRVALKGIAPGTKFSLSEVESRPSPAR